jgi:hypothetical protein
VPVTPASDERELIQLNLAGCVNTSPQIEPSCFDSKKEFEEPSDKGQSQNPAVHGKARDSLFVLRCVAEN